MLPHRLSTISIVPYQIIVLQNGRVESIGSRGSFRMRQALPPPPDMEFNQFATGDIDGRADERLMCLSLSRSFASALIDFDPGLVVMSRRWIYLINRVGLLKC